MDPYTSSRTSITNSCINRILAIFIARGSLEPLFFLLLFSLSGVLLPSLWEPLLPSLWGARPASLRGPRPASTNFRWERQGYVNVKGWRHGDANLDDSIAWESFECDQGRLRSAGFKNHPEIGLAWRPGLLFWLSNHLIVKWALYRACQQALEWLGSIFDDFCIGGKGISMKSHYSQRCLI